eukprot:scaffold5479_cov199-Amphora_coffeaeformis.AAC.91
MSTNSNSGEPRPVVVLTAGGVGRSAAPKKKGSKTAAVAVDVDVAVPPESRESKDSFLDQHEEGGGGGGIMEDDVVPFVDEPAVPKEVGTVAGKPFAKSSNRNRNSSLTSKEDPHGRTSTSVPGFASQSHSTKTTELFWLLVCFLGIMASFVCYGLLLEYATSGGRKLHELSFLFVTSGLYTVTAAAGRYVRDETPTSIPPARYVIYPVQVLAKSCKPVPVMLMGAAMGKKYSLRKYINVCLIVLGVALFMGGGKGSSKHRKSEDGDDDGAAGASQIIGIVMLFISLCFDGGTGAYEDKLMSVHSVQPFDLMFNIQMGKTILAGIGLLVLNQIHMFIQMCNDMGFLLIALGLSGALGQVFIFVTIAKFGALTCSIIGLARKVTTLVASIWFYGHYLGPMQFMGLVISVGSMVMNFWGKKDKGQHHHGPPTKQDPLTVEELQKMLDNDGNAYEDEKEEVEMTPSKDEEAAVTSG